MNTTKNRRKAPLSLSSDNFIVCYPKNVVADLERWLNHPYLSPPVISPEVFQAVGHADFPRKVR
jgi:hypothetical protein